MRPFILFIFLSSQFVFSQINRDSLKNIINTEKSDSLKVIAYTELAKDMLGQPKDVLNVLSDMNKFSATIKDDRSRALCLRKMGALYSYITYYDKALEITFQAAKLFEQAKDTFGLAYCYNNIANFYNYKGEFTKNDDFQRRSLEYHLKSIALRDTSDPKDSDPLTSSYNNIGNTYMELKKFEVAMKYFDKAYKVYVGKEDKSDLAMVNSNIARCYVSMASQDSDKSKYKKALQHYLAASKLEEKGTGGAASTIIQIGWMYKMLGQMSLAESYLKTGFQQAVEQRERTAVLDGAQKLARFYEEQKDYRSSVHYFAIYDANKDSLINEQNSANIEQMQTIYEFDKKENQISKLNQESKIKALELKKSGEEKTFLVIGLLVTFALLGFVVYSFFQKQKANRIIELQKHKVEQQKLLIEEKHKEITDSINYAERIQKAFLATDGLLNQNLKEYFIFFKPKDVVSGDFYWGSKLSNGKFTLVVADSTGHGVPGAIMSLLNITSLEKAIEQSNKPADILNLTRRTIIERLRKDGSAEGGKDGMDCTLIALDQHTISVAAANNPLWIVRETELMEIKADKMPVGKHDKDTDVFSEYIVDIKKGDMIYMLTDGFPDQFGGEEGKKFMRKKLKKLLTSIANESMERQRSILEKVFSDWKGERDQVDDVTLVGIRI